LLSNQNSIWGLRENVPCPTRRYNKRIISSSTSKRDRPEVGIICILWIFIHGSAYSIDHEKLESKEWCDAVACDSCVSDVYVNSNNIVYFAQVLFFGFIQSVKEVTKILVEVNSLVRKINCHKWLIIVCIYYQNIIYSDRDTRDYFDLLRKIVIHAN
jgi:hypothetical protein